MSAILLLRNPEPATGMPEYIKSVFNTKEEAVAQAVNDLVTEQRAEKAGYTPVQINDESDNMLVGRAEMEETADQLREQLKAAGSGTTTDQERVIGQFFAAKS
jgi:hypothetical protein